jgi:hypothetical protein
MSLAAVAIQPFFVPQLLHVRGRVKGRTLADLLLPTEKSGFYLSFDDASTTFTFDFQDPPKVSEALASDCSRLASAAFQTICTISEDLEDGERLSWALIQIYYSSFYAGHAIMRLLGESYSFLNTRHSNRVRSIAAAQGFQPITVDAGLYKCVIMAGSMGYSATKVRGGSGGVHEAFWLALMSRIRQLQQDIAQGLLVKSDAQAVIAKLVEYEAVATRQQGMMTWLSSIRNEIQYRQGLDVWAPCKVKKINRSTLGRLAAQWCSDPLDFDFRDTGDGALPSFVAACAFLPALCLVLLARLDRIATGPGRSFAFDGALSYANKKQKITA